MTVHQLRPRQDQPAVVRFSGSAKGLAVAFGLIQAFELPDCHVHVWDGGQCVVFDFTFTPHPASAVRSACASLGMEVDELAAETAAGEPAIELRGQQYLDGVLRTVRAVVPLDRKPLAW